jgi:D-alanine-D-alanine ligase
VQPAARRIPEEETASRIFEGLFFLPPPNTAKSQLLDLNRLAASAFRVMGCRDVALIDFRLDSTAGDKPYLLDIDPLPDLNPTAAELCIQAQAAGWRYDYLINRLLEEAIKRQGKAGPVTAPVKRAEVNMQTLKAA